MSFQYLTHLTEGPYLGSLVDDTLLHFNSGATMLKLKREVKLNRRP